MSGPSSPHMGGFSGMLSSVSAMSREELERMGRAIGQAVLARRAAGEEETGSEQQIPSPTDPNLSVPRRQATELDTETPDDDFVPPYSVRKR